MALVAEVDALRCHPKLVLLDYFTNDNVAVDKPLSHAALLRSFILQGDFSLIRNTPPPPVTGKRKRE